METITLELEDELLEQTERYLSEHGITLDELITQCFKALLAADKTNDAQ